MRVKQYVCFTVNVWYRFEQSTHTLMCKFIVSYEQSCTNVIKQLVAFPERPCVYNSRCSTQNYPIYLNVGSREALALLQ